jgi:hypothetical protein
MQQGNAQHQLKHWCSHPMQACIRLDAADSLGTTLTASQSGMALTAISGGAATCTTSRQGVYLVVQYAKPASPSPAKAVVASPSPITYSSGSRAAWLHNAPMQRLPIAAASAAPAAGCC